MSYVVAIVIDALGGVAISPELKYHLAQLKELSESHRTFVFLLAEDHIFKRYPEVEHYSQSVLHLVHDPLKEPPRRIYLQKSRNQRFRAGVHMLRFDEDRGLQVYPSINARSAYAHDLLELNPPQAHASALFHHANPANGDTETKKESFVDLDSKGAVVFLMGPPGTFKQTIATRFCAGADEKQSALYVSFKADRAAVQTAAPEGLRVVPHKNEDQKPGNIAWFLDARSPIKTPEEVLGAMSMVLKKKGNIGRAVIWGLRRLADMPFFAEGRSVQFLEALVTLLKAERIISLLVDWPDVERANTLPVVDLSHYILLTRLCKGRHELHNNSKGPVVEPADLKSWREEIWKPSVRHAAFLRVQRDVKQFHRNTGYLLQRIDTEAEPSPEAKPRSETAITPVAVDFERQWRLVGRRWEQDPGLS